MKRIVKLILLEGEEENFLNIYRTRNPSLKNVKGCQSTCVLKSITSDQEFFTLSVWDSVQALEDYRNSEYFKETWSLVKQLLGGKTQVWNLDEINISP